MGTVGLALFVGGMALLFSGMIFLISVRDSHPSPKESFEDNRRRIEQYLREMRESRGEIDV
jgi:hypothetical protein